MTQKTVSITPNRKMWSSGQTVARGNVQFLYVEYNLPGHLFHWRHLSFPENSLLTATSIHVTVFRVPLLLWGHLSFLCNSILAAASSGLIKPLTSILPPLAITVIVWYSYSSLLNEIIPYN